MAQLFADTEDTRFGKDMCPYRRVISASYPNFITRECPFISVRGSPKFTVDPMHVRARICPPSVDEFSI